MKHRFLTLLSVVLISAFSFTTRAEDPASASKQIFDWTPFQDSKMLELFSKALEDGRNYPTEEEFKNTFGFDIEFARSHVRPKSIEQDLGKQLNKNVNPNRKVWMNIPSGVGKVIGGYPSSEFHNDVYSMWQYTTLFGSWNHGIFQAPGVWGDAAHKHGTDIFSGIKFFEGWTPGSGDGAYSKLVTTKKADGTFKYAEPLINVLMYLGLDGINYNWEDGSYSQADIVAFHKELFRIAEEKGFDNFHIGLYTASSILTQSNASVLYYGNDAKKKTVDLMLNYSGGDFSTGFATSVAAAKSVAQQTNNLYSGVWIVTMNRAWPMMASDGAKDMNICLWGEHDQSRFFSYNAGKDGFDIQENYQKLLERSFSGGNRNPANRPQLSGAGNNWRKDGDKEPLSTFGGLATLVPERSTIYGDLPFQTDFQLGNGERYNYKGKKTFGNWYNMGMQDYQPTFRWLVYDANTTTVSDKIQPKYTHIDAYNGGSMLLLEGTATTQGTDIVLYRTDLNVSSTNPKVNVAVKAYREGKESYEDGAKPTNLYVILKKAGSDQWEEIAVGDTEAETWKEVTLPMAGFATGDKIEFIGLRVKATTEDPKYRMFVGKLALTDDRKVEDVAPVEDLIVEVKKETKQSMAVKLNWKLGVTMSERATKTGLVYNDEGNVDHFEIMYKKEQNGKILEVARTSSWAHYIGDFLFDTPDEKLFIGVRSVSIDGKTYSPVTWVEVPRGNQDDLPEGTKDEYCKSELDPNAAGAHIAREVRYLEVVKTIGLEKNLNYTANAPQTDGTQYVNATNYSFTAEQGETFEFFFKAHKDTQYGQSGDGLKWCFAKAYIDWDGNGVFYPAREEVLDLGTPNEGTPKFEEPGVTVPFTIPGNAVPGTTRMRIVFSDAWFPHPGPCGLTAKGFSIDFTVNITGDNAGEVQEDIHDKGEADEPKDIRNTGINDVIGNSLASTFYPNPVENVVNFKNTQSVWIYSVDGKLMLRKNLKSSQVNVSNLPKGVYMVRMLNKGVVRSGKLIKK